MCIKHNIKKNQHKKKKKKRKKLYKKEQEKKSKSLKIPGGYDFPPISDLLL